MIIEMNAQNPQPRKVEQVAKILSEGGLVAYPTDTVYGIGCDIFHRDAVERLHRLVREIKGNDKHAPLSFICRDLSNIAEYAMISDFAYRTMRRVLPGPYTFILTATKLVPKVMLTRRKTVGIRVPDAAIIAALVERIGNPIATTSAALPTGELIADPWTIEDLYGHHIEAVIDGGFLFPEPSTIVDFTQDPPVLVREGKGEALIFE